MTQEEYNQLDYDYAHCAGANCQKAGQCLHHTVYTMLQTNKHDYYTVVNPNVTTGKQPCPIYEADRKERFDGVFPASMIMCEPATFVV